MKTHKGFTVIELVAVISFLVLAAIATAAQVQSLRASERDNQRKTAINAMYYNLEKVYYPDNHAYPTAINSKVLTAMDPALFTDPNGKKLGDNDSDYRYEGINCTDQTCQDYKLSAKLEREADYVKTGRR